MQWCKAKSCEIVSDDGESYLDFTSGVIVSNVGHGHPHIVQKLMSCLNRPLLHCYKYPYADRSLLSRRLLESVGNPFSGVCYGVSGAEAVEISLRLCFRVNARKAIVAFSNSFHGKSLGAAMISDAFRHKLPAAAPKADWVEIVEYPVDRATGSRALDLLTTRSNEISGVFVECVQGSSLQKINRGFLQQAASLCAQRNIVLVVDEIQTGFYRAGCPFAYMEYGIRPNVICVGKGLTSSLPLAAVLFDSKVEPFYNPEVDCSTHAANPLSVAAAHACLDIYQTRQFQENLRASQSEYACQMESLKRILRPEIQCVSHGTLFGGLVFSRALTAAAECFVAECLKRHLFVARPIGIHRNIVKFVPPLAITVPEVTRGFALIKDACAAADLLVHPSRVHPRQLISPIDHDSVSQRSSVTPAVITGAEEHGEHPSSLSG